MKFQLTICCLLAVTASSRADEPWGKYDIYAPGHASLDYYAYPKYAYDYAVNDPHTGDNKAQWEKRDGDVVRGAYSLVEPDGSLRIVEYYADDHSGFNAVVKRIGPNLHPSQPLIKPVPIYKAPIPTLSSYGPIGNYAPVAPIIKVPVASIAPITLGHDKGYGLSYGLDKGLGYNLGYGSDKGLGYNLGYGSDKGLGYNLGYGSDKGLGYDAAYGLNKGIGLGYAAPLAAPIPVVKASLPAYTYNSWIPIKSDGNGYYGYGKAPIVTPVNSWVRGPLLEPLESWGKGPILDGHYGWGKGQNQLY